MLTDKAMKASELRIGNCIEYNGMIKTIFSINKKEFITFDTDEVIVGKYRYEQSPSLHISNFKPIPLTEEWLLKLGVCKAQNNWFRFTAMPSENKEIITIHINTSSFITSCFGDEALEPCFFKECKYVHQLQNLYFALTGEELTLKP